MLVGDDVNHRTHARVLLLCLAPRLPEMMLKICEVGNDDQYRTYSVVPPRWVKYTHSATPSIWVISTHTTAPL